MINRIIDFSVKNKLIIGLFTLALIVTGIWSMRQVPIDAVPDITNNQVQVIAQAPNLGTEDIEQFVTYPIELAMANLPGVLEIRSVSRFGLCVVTIVFKDDMGTYLPRQLVNEKLVSVRETLPKNSGDVEMGPISTGLGEIYQYTLEVDESVVDDYSITELRTIQDWIIKRQMAMVTGVVEVNSFGGNVKQYEVVVKPHQLKSMGLTLSDVLTALEDNNANAGGAYIVKDHFANYIRGEGLARSMEDIENIVVTNMGGIPIYIKNVAEVRIGKAIRYGAFTKGGKGEAVGGMIMMLKGENSNTTIDAVKTRVEKIQKSLPDGISIVPFLDRSELITQTTRTVKRNLFEGGLIVIFVLVLLLGNWRGGLIVASTIPLSLLFAFILMHFFDVWANLMSLGAIDFGIIVDGAVIIVESTVFLIYRNFDKGRVLTPKERDHAATTSSKKMMNAAFFGQLIILIVFIPILSLEGIEGKMFKPMALTFMFAMIGAMILCLTYVPMVSALFLRNSKTKIAFFGDRIISWAEDLYIKLLLPVLEKPKRVIATAAVLLASALFLFTRMGGEFIPQLDEGSIAFHIMLKPGSSLEEATATSTKVENLMLEKFPEIDQIMSRFGVADVPTDPMPMDVADCFVTFKPKSEWTSASSKDELIEMMKEELEVIPGVSFEFSQPIEMRFNELLTGVREDIAIKVFGEDLDVLAQKSLEITGLINGIEGIGDMKAEATVGMPQINIKYQRHKLAQYGLSIAQINQLVQTAFAGTKAGVVFEGEKRFDLVLRVHESLRTGINDVKNLFITLNNGTQIPIKEVAEITYTPGPMQISRDNTNRRIYVGINVRGRDVESLVTEIQQKLDDELVLPPGYYIRYGGAFENLERATAKLKIVVPIALGLIFILIFLALNSLKQTVMIYLAIPLATIGGVFSLWIRDLPFSISAGVGFIVLFGVAVLNGLVLISGLNELKDEGMTNLNDRITLGSKRRIRPILLTALTDILGFLPMAISASAGAEVQRPLATVVIGGLITSTLLTLFVLPILYKWVESRKRPLKMKPVLATILVVGAVSTFPISAEAQEKTITDVETAINIALQNNGDYKVAESNVTLEERAKRGAFNPGKTAVDVQYGQYNSYQNDFAFEISQAFEFPTVYGAQNKLAKARIASSRAQLNITSTELQKRINKSWHLLAYLEEKEKLLTYQDSLYERFLHAATIRYETETTGYLEKAMAETQVMELQNSLDMLRADIDVVEEELRYLINDSVYHEFTPKLFVRYQLRSNPSSEVNPQLLLAKTEVETAEAEKKTYKNKFLPDFTIGYFNQSMTGAELPGAEIANSSYRFDGVLAGIQIPLFFNEQNTAVKTAEIKRTMAQTKADYYERVVSGELEMKKKEWEKFANSLTYYEKQALPQAELMIKSAQLSFEEGEISYIEYFQNMNQALSLKFNYLNTLNDYNQTLIDLDALGGFAITLGTITD